MKIMLTFIALLIASQVFAETISYEIHKSATGTLVCSGNKNYSKNDVIIRHCDGQSKCFAEKFIELKQNYKIGARIFRKSKLTGFGLLAELTKDDYSWEQFKHVEGNLFRQLQEGKGFVKVRTSGFPLHEVLEEVVFLDDAKVDFHLGGPSSKESHVIVIKKGSVLKFD